MLRRDRGDHQSGLTLIELLVGMIITGVLSTMVLMGWFALQDSYSFTTRSDKQRELARDAMARVTREIRDIQAQEEVNPVVVATENEFWFYSGFNLPNQLPTDKPRATRYTYDPDTDTLYRQRDRSTDANQSPMDEPLQPVVKDVVNGQVPSGTLPSTPVFTYVIYDGEGHQVRTSTPNSTEMQRLLSVEINLIVDLNPGRSPNHVDLRTAAQPRNLRLY